MVPQASLPVISVSCVIVAECLHVNLQATLQILVWSVPRRVEIIITYLLLMLLIVLLKFPGPCNMTQI